MRRSPWSLALFAAALGCSGLWTPSTRESYPPDSYRFTATDDPAWLRETGGDRLFSLAMDAGVALPAAGMHVEHEDPAMPGSWRRVDIDLTGESFAPGTAIVASEGDPHLDGTAEGKPIAVHVSIDAPDLGPDTALVVWTGEWTPEPLEARVVAVLDAHRAAFDACDALLAASLAAMTEERWEEAAVHSQEASVCMTAFQAEVLAAFAEAGIQDGDPVDPIYSRWTHADR